jgi:MIP family channel proteins
MKKYVAEFIGTFALILVGAGAGAYSNAVPGGINLVGVALAHGLTLAGMIYALGHISGIHINPAVTIAMKITGKIGMKDAIGYIIAQLIGAGLAGFMLKAIFNPGRPSGYLGATDLAINISPGLGVLCEAVGTFLFFTVIFGAAVDGRTAGNVVGLAIGLTLAGLILFLGPQTGASFNPARTFGPALASGHWDNFWVYLVGPIVGGSLAGIVQTQLFIKPPSSN